MLKARALLAVPLGLLLAAVAVRAMVFQSPPDHPLRMLQPMFSGHPDALIDGAMRDIGSSAAKGGMVPESARVAMIRAARRAPLAAQPFLVSGTIAQIAGDGARAEQLFLAARLRDPRGAAARYFLADRFLRTGRIQAGLVEMAVLARLSERASEPLGPALAAYARTAGAIPELQQFFRGSPRNRELTLDILSQDPANAGLVLALAPPLPVRRVPPANWQVNVVQAQITAGNYDAAKDIWQKLNGVGSIGLLYDPQFRDRTASPPFNWSLTLGNAGVAEASASGGLEVIYYGRDDAAFASQMVRLAPGSYRLAMRISAPLTTGGLAWAVSCAAGPKQKLLQLALSSARANIVAANFTVPSADCPIQNVELRGQPIDSPDTAQVTITGLELVPAGSMR